MTRRVISMVCATKCEVAASNSSRVTSTRCFLSWKRSSRLVEARTVSIFLASSTATRSSVMKSSSSEGSLSSSRPACSMKRCKNRSSRHWSQSAPPSRRFPSIAITSTLPARVLRMVVSKVPPPRSKMSRVCSSSWRAHSEIAAATGSGMMPMTSRPAISPACFVA